DRHVGPANVVRRSSPFCFGHCCTGQGKRSIRPSKDVYENAELTSASHRVVDREHGPFRLFTRVGNRNRGFEVSRAGGERSRIHAGKGPCVVALNNDRGIVTSLR